MEIPDLLDVAVGFSVYMDPVQHLNQLTDFHKVWYEHMLLRSTSALQFVMTYDH